MATLAMQPKSRSLSTSSVSQSDNAAVLDGIKRSLPGLVRFLKIDLRSQTLSGEAKTELERLTSLLVELERSAGRREGEPYPTENGSDRPDGIPNGDVHAKSDAAFSGFLAQASIKGMGFVSWNRRWAILKHGETTVKLFRTRTDSKPISDLDLKGCRITVADPHECGEKALTLKVSNPDSDQPVFYCTYVESEYQKCMRAFAAATGVPHSEDDFSVPTTSASMSKVMNIVSVGSGRETPDMGSSVRSTGSGFLDGGQDMVMDSTYDVPRNHALSASRENLDSAAAGDDDKRHTKWSVSGDGDYSEIRIENAENEPTSPLRKPLRRDPTEAVPDLPPRASMVQFSSGNTESRNEESNYESLPFEEQGSGSDSSEHYEDLEPKEGESGYRSTDSTGGTSILGWFRRTSAERSSSRVEKTRKHRRSVSANELTDCDQDGYLFKRSSTGLTWKRRWCVLKERAFYYYRSRDDSRAQNTIVLPGWQISAASDEVKRPFALKLSHEGMPAYFFAAETEDDFNTWLEVFRQSLRIVHGPQDTYDVPPRRTSEQKEAESLLKAVQGFGGSGGQEDANDAFETYQVPRSYQGGQSATPNADHPLGATGENEIEEENVYNVPRPSSTDQDQPPPLPSGPRPLPRKTKGSSSRHVNDDSSGEDTTNYDQVPLPGTAVERAGRERTSHSAYGSSTNNNEVDTAGNFERGGVYNSLKKGARKLVGRSKSSASTGSRVIVHSADRTIQGCLNVRGSYRWSKHFCELRQQRFFVYKGMTRDEKAIVNEIRVLGMSVEHAEKETKRKNSFCLVRKRGGHHARAVYFFCDDEEDYKQWFFGLAEATMIKIQAVEDISTIHKGGKAAPSTVGLDEARKRYTMPGEMDTGIIGQTDGQASKALPSSTYETGVTLKTSLPRWLQDEMESNPLFQGQLEKRNGPGLWHPRYCIIENGTLACYAQKGSQIPTQVQPLANCTVTGSNKDRRKNVFKVVPPSPFATLYFSAETRREMFEWVSYINIAASASDARQDGKPTRSSVAVGQSFRASRRGRKRALSTGDPPSRGFFSRIRSWSVENLSFGRRRSAYESDAEETDGDTVYGGSMNFERNAVSLGHGPHRRSRRGFGGGKKRVNAKTSPVNSGELMVEESKNGVSEYFARWCEVKQLTLSIFDQAQDRRPSQTVKLPGCTVMVHHSDNSEERVIQVTPLAGKQVLRVKVPGSEETFRSWLECFRTAASLAGGSKRSWRDSFRRKRPQRAPSPEDVVTAEKKRISLVGDHTSAPGPYALYEGSGSIAAAGGSPGVLPDYASKLASDMNALTAEHQGSKAASKPQAPQPPLMRRALPNTPGEMSSPNSPGIAKTPRASIKARAPATPLQRANAHDVTTPTAASDSKSLSSPQRQVPSIPQRKQSIPSSPYRSPSSASLPAATAASVDSPAGKNLGGAPRFGATRSTSMAIPTTKPKPSVAPKPPADRGRASSNTVKSPSMTELSALPDIVPGVDAKAYGNLKQRYSAKAEAITSQGNAKQASLSKERSDVYRQQSELQQKLNDCRSRMNAGGRAPTMDLRREEAELQNRAGVLDSKLGRINDQMMRITTELKSAVDRLERERDVEIKTLKGDAEDDSAM